MQSHVNSSLALLVKVYDGIWLFSINFALNFYKKKCKCQYFIFWT